VSWCLGGIPVFQQPARSDALTIVVQGDRLVARHRRHNDITVAQVDADSKFNERDCALRFGMKGLVRVRNKQPRVNNRLLPVSAMSDTLPVTN
jgi:hypothetical protein